MPDPSTITLPCSGWSNRNRNPFAGGDIVELHPGFTPRHRADTCAEMAQTGPRLEAVKARLLSVARETFGRQSTTEDGFHLDVNGRTIALDAAATGTRYTFTLPQTARIVRCVCEAGSPPKCSPPALTSASSASASRAWRSTASVSPRDTVDRLVRTRRHPALDRRRRYPARGPHHHRRAAQRVQHLEAAALQACASAWRGTSLRPARTRGTGSILEAPAVLVTLTIFESRSELLMLHKL